jgi:pyruvate formate lyase activating enzyme
MQIAGFVKNSFLDYPGHIAAVVFVPGCNMDCWYCHNRALWKEKNLYNPAYVLDYLQKRRGFLDGVVISGGEPTLQKDLADFIRQIRDMGYLVKLDTNGLKPDIVASLLGDVDYVAMDIKAPPGELHRVVTFDLDDTPIWQTADLVIKSGVGYEFRTTFMPFLTVDDISAIASRVKGAKRYVVQQYRRPESIAIQPDPHSPDIIKKAAEAAREFIPHTTIRGL